MHQHLAERKAHMIECYGKEPTTMHQLGQCLLATLQKNQKNFSRVVGLSWKLDHYVCVKNSHHCPISGQTNWGRDLVDIPAGYPGWQGRIWIRYEKEFDQFGSEAFCNTLCHTGSGGAGSYHGPWESVNTASWRSRSHRITSRHIPTYPPLQLFSYELSIFDEDWSSLGILKRQTWAMLANKDFKFTQSVFFWEDKATAKRDAAFMHLYLKAGGPM